MNATEHPSRLRSFRRRVWAGWVAAALVSIPCAGEILYLSNGRSIVVDRYWEQGEQILYEKNGSTFGFPARMLERVDHDPATKTTERADSDEPTGFRNEIVSGTIDEARTSAKQGDGARAESLYRSAIKKAPDVLEARLELAELYYARGNYPAAQTELERAKRLFPKNMEVRERLGDVYYGRGRTALAIREWQTALASEPSPGLLYKLKKALRENDDDISFEEIDRTRFLIRYDGSVNESIGRLVARALDQEYYQLARDFSFSPNEPIRVTLYTNQEFQDVTHAPEWASGLNDGEIRIPVEGLSEMTPKLRRVLRHELTHSFINAYTDGNCPSWFHEGYAQLREGSLRMDPYPRLREAQANDQILPLWSLEGPLINYSKEKALLVYAQALAATEYLAARRGDAALVKILAQLRAKKTMNEALASVVGLDYQEFQTAWEADLARYRPPAR